MRVRLVVASQAEAIFYDVPSKGRRMTVVGRLEDPKAHLHDRDFNSDMSGRVFHAAPAGGRRGAVVHHDTAGERLPRKHEAALFARSIAEQLEHAQEKDEFDRLVVMAAPAFLGLLRKSIPKSLRLRVAAEVGKDLVHEAPRAIQAHIPPEVFDELAGSEPG